MNPAIKDGTSDRQKKILASSREIPINEEKEDKKVDEFYLNE